MGGEEWRHFTASTGFPSQRLAVGTSGSPLKSTYQAAGRLSIVSAHVADQRRTKCKRYCWNKATTTEVTAMGGMIPLSDASRQTRAVPFVTVAIIFLNFAAFGLELAGGEAFVKQWSMIPADIAQGHHWITIITAMFLHAGWLHIIGNMLFLWAFGPAVEDSMGPLRYMSFYLACGIAAFLAQIAMGPHSTVPNVGASGAIAGVMGAFLITYPSDRIKTLLFFGIIVRIRFIPAALLIGLWFLIQLFSQRGVVANADTGGVAYAAHVGGFIFGLVFARAFEHNRDTSGQEA